jgi:hypothetical protein
MSCGCAGIGSCAHQAVGRPPAVEVFIRRRSRLAVDPQLTERIGGMEAVEFRLGLVEQLVEESAERCWRAVLVGIGEHDRRIRWRTCGYAGHRLDPTVRALDVRRMRDNFGSVIPLGTQFRLADALENRNGDLAVTKRE